MDILKLQKEKLIESTIINCDRNLFIYNEILKRLPELIDDNLSYYKNNNQQSFEKMILVRQLLRRKGMGTVLDDFHSLKLNAIINFFSKTLEKMDSIDSGFKVEIVEENGKKKCLLKCEDFLIKEFEYISMFDIIKQLLKEDNEKDLDLFIISAFYFGNDESRALLAWVAHLLTKNDFVKLKEYRKENPDKESINYIAEEIALNVFKKLKEMGKIP